MSKAKQLWLGWAVLLLNGWHLGSGLVAGEVGGFGGLVNPDRLPSLAYRPGWFVAILGIYAVLTALGVYLIMTAGAGSEETER